MAKVILDKPNAVATTSMRGLARQAKVTPPTVIRLANALGFKNYEQFKRVFLQTINNQNFEQRANWLQQASRSQGESTIVHALADASHHNIQSFFHNVDFELVAKAADLITKSPNVYIVAAGALHWMAGYMRYVGNMVIPHLRAPTSSGNLLIEDLLSLKEKDVVVAFSYNPYAIQAIEAVEFTISRGAQLIYFTDSKAAPLASDADILILQSTASPQFFPSMVSVISAIRP